MDHCAVDACGGDNLLMTRHGAFDENDNEVGQRDAW